MKITFKSLFLASVAAITFGCSNDKSESPKSDMARFVWVASQEANASIKVLNQFGEPLAQAQILVGSAENNPFKGNFLTTDKNGVVKVPTAWVSEEHVTVEAAGFIRQTLLSQKPGDITLKLNPSYLPQRPEVKGQVSGLPVSNGDKLVDFALVIPGMTRSDLLNFDLNAVISPFSDTITIIGQQAKIPGNVSLPTQKESYIFPITLSKPIYRLTSPTLGAKRFFAVRGQFPFKKTIDEMQAGKPFYDLVNNFSIQGGGMRDVTLVSPTTTLDIPGNELVFNSKIKTQPAAVAADEVLMIVAVSEVANTLVPTDIKKFAGETSLQMSSLPNKKTFIVNVIKRQAEFDPAAANTSGSDRISAGISVHNETLKPLLLPLVESPTLKTSAGLDISLPAVPNTNGINGIAVSAAVSDLVDIPNGAETIVNVNRRWEILGLGWQTQSIQLPNWPLPGAVSARRRVEINYIGSTTHQSVDLDDNLIEAATHVTHASTDF